MSSDHTKKGKGQAQICTITLSKDCNNVPLENKKAKTIAISCLEWFNQNQEAPSTFIRTVRPQEDFSLRIVD
jgi:hypothetical protein